MIINVKNVTVEKPGINSTCIICHQFLLCSLKGECVDMHLHALCFVLFKRCMR